MVGGKVLEVCEVPNRPDVLFIEVVDRPYSKLEKCGVLIENNETSQRIQIGDSMWWQSGWCYWTPQGSEGKCGIDYDIKIPKRSGSGVTFDSVRGIITK